MKTNNNITAADIVAMTFNADAFCAADYYDADELQQLLDSSSINELSGEDAESARRALGYEADDDVRVFRGVELDRNGYYQGDVFYFSIY